MKIPVVIACAAALVWFAAACRKGSETAPPAAEKKGDGAAAAFAALVQDVESYMKTHDLRNTKPDEMKEALVGFQRAFEALAPRAAPDAALSARCRLAAESMALYVQSLRTPPSDTETMRLALEAQAKWERAKGGPARPPGS